MKHPTVLLRTRAKATGDLVSAGGFGLPLDLLEKARGRLARFVILMAGVFLIASILIEVPLSKLDDESLKIIRAAQFVAIALHLLLFVLVSRRNFNHSFVLNLGLVYEVLLCLGISIADCWISYDLRGFFPEITFASLVIAVYPLIVPSPLGRTLITAIAAAATTPLSLLILRQAASVPVESADYIIISLTPVISVAIALFGSHVVYGMNLDVAKARQLGSYHLETLLGRGGMGEVWSAKHQMLARKAAVKLVRPEVLGTKSAKEAERMLKRFEREAHATASMRSQHTIQLYDFGISDQGTFYYVMELLDGLDLESLVSRFGPMLPERVIYFLRQACHSLAEAHVNGLIHRDIKPANLYVCRYGLEVDFIKILDFGLVKSAQSQGETDTKLTAEMLAGGTPAYMAPEQILGNRPIDARTDIYALGCVAYWLLTGQLVFEGKTAMEMMTNHVHTPPPALSTRTELSIPDSVEQVILVCLEKEPKRRPQSASALDESLRMCTTKESWTAETARTWWNTHLPGQDVLGSPLEQGKTR